MRRRRREKAQDTPRDYVLELDRAAGEAPLLTVYGGKITTYRRLAEEALGKLAPVLGARPDWTGRRACRAATSAVDGVERLVAELRGLLAVPERGPCAPPGARLWHAGRHVSSARRQP